MDWSGSRVLVTGAGGFIGSHLAEALTRSGAAVRGFVRYTSRADIGALRMVDDDVRDAIEIAQGDLRSYPSVLRATDGMDVVFHLGAAISIPYSYVSPDETFQTNVQGTLNVAQACLASEVGRVVHTSTSEVFGTALTVPMDEGHPLQAQSPYSASKIGADKAVESFTKSFELPAVTVRPFNCYGPRQSTRAVIPTIITQLLNGGELRLGSLHPTRDFTFVADTVAAFLAAAQASEVVGTEINVGTGKEISIGELVETIGRLVGQAPNLVSEAERIRPQASEVERLCADATRAKESLGWEARTTLEDGLRQTIDWVVGHTDFYGHAGYHR